MFSTTKMLPTKKTHKNGKTIANHCIGTHPQPINLHILTPPPPQQKKEDPLENQTHYTTRQAHHIA